LTKNVPWKGTKKSAVTEAVSDPAAESGIEFHVTTRIVGSLRVAVKEFSVTTGNLPDVVDCHSRVGARPIPERTVAERNASDSVFPLPVQVERMGVVALPEYESGRDSLPFAIVIRDDDIRDLDFVVFDEEDQRGEWAIIRAELNDVVT